MNREREWEYLKLVRELLNCEDNKEDDCLAAHIELVDIGLIKKLRVVAKLLSYKENDSNNDGTIRWLINFADQLTLSLGLDIKQKAVVSEIDFLIISFFAIAGNEELEVIHKLFQANLPLLNNKLVEEMQVWASSELLKTTLEEQSYLAKNMFNFGRIMVQFPMENKAINLELAISAYEIALKVYTREAYFQEWAATQNNIAVAYEIRIEGNKEENIEKALASYKAALEFYTQEAHSEIWAIIQTNIALTHSKQKSTAENLEKVISAYELALEVFTKEMYPEEWIEIQNNLAHFYSEQHTGSKAENLEKAIRACLAVLEMPTLVKDSEDWAMIQHTIANTYMKRIRGSKVDNIEKAVTAYESSLKVYTLAKYPGQWAMVQNNLANAYRNRVMGDKAKNLEKAIQACLEALKIYTKEQYPYYWAKTQNSLGSTFQCFKEDVESNLENALRAYELALEVSTQESYPEMWAITQNNLATIYINRLRGNPGENIENSIRACEAALEVYTQESYPEMWAMVKHNLASAHVKRIRGDKAKNIDKAIEIYESILSIRSKKEYPKEWGTTQNSLASAYSERLEGNKSENIEKAIRSYKSAIKIKNKEEYPEDWATIQSNISNSYRNRIEGNKAENMEKAIQACLESLKIRIRETYPEDWAKTQHNLGAIYSEMFNGQPLENIKKAISCYELSLEVHTYQDFPNNCRQTSRNLGNLYFQQQEWKLASVTYQKSLNAAEKLYQSCILLDSKADELKETANLPRQMAYALARTGEFKKAVEVLEQNRARGLSESIDRDRANLTQLQQINNELYEEYQNITNQLQTIEAQQRDRMTSIERHSLTPETMRDTATHLRQQLDNLIKAIRQVQGYESFLALPTFADVRQAISEIDRPLIYLLSTSAGSLALIVTPENINTVWCNNFTESQLTTLRETWFTAYNQSETNRSAWLNTIDHVTHQLWEPLMAPLLDQLAQQKIDRAVLIPTGYLSLLPLHAAWTEDSHAPNGRQYVIDRIHFTYAPNAKSLISAQSIATKTTGNAILAINNPTQDRKLPNAQREIQQITSYFQQPKTLSGAEAQAATVLNQLPSYQYIHLSCHGTANLNEPLKSGLEMSDRLLTLKEFLALKLGEDNNSGIRLAVLSACETGLPGTENTDEAISLPTGLLQAGVAGIIASLWAVNDGKTMLLLTKFYELWQGEAALPIDVALYQSQLWLRNITEKDLAALLGKRTRNPEQYQHLYYWAAFSYTGI